MSFPPSPTASSAWPPMTTFADLELGFARLAAILGPCAHPDAIPVDLLLTGETVAWLCPACGTQLPAGWL
jgi:hypothetical protein